jgi:hypothetical protein
MLQYLADENEFALLALIGFFFICTGLIISWFCINPTIRRVLGPYEGVLPTFLGVPAGMFALTAAFMGNSLWENYTGAADAIRLEAQGLAAYIETGETVPEFKALKLPQIARDYTHSVLEDEWGGKAKKQASPKTEKLFKDLQLATFRAAEKKRSTAETAVLMSAYRTIQEGRRARLGYVMFIVDPVRWFGVMLLALLVQLSIAAVHFAKPKALVLAMPLGTATILTVLCTIALTLSTPYIGWYAVSNAIYLPLLQ